MNLNRSYGDVLVTWLSDLWVQNQNVYSDTLGSSGKERAPEVRGQDWVLDTLDLTPESTWGLPHEGRQDVSVTLKGRSPVGSSYRVGRNLSPRWTTESHDNGSRAHLNGVRWNVGIVGGILFIILVGSRLSFVLLYGRVDTFQDEFPRLTTRTLIRVNSPHGWTGKSSAPKGYWTSETIR